MKKASPSSKPKKKTAGSEVVERRNLKTPRSTQTPSEFFSSIKPTPEYVKHLIECKCFLPQFKNSPTPVYHKFVVFSELDDLGGIKPSYAECNNCGLVHRVVEIETSSLVGKESSKFVPTSEDIEIQVPERLAKVIKQHECDVHVWQEAKFIVDNQLWGRFIVLAKEKINNGTSTTGKICQILGDNLFKIEQFEREEISVKGD